jgi:hypothetical protein
MNRRREICTLSDFVASDNASHAVGIAPSLCDVWAKRNTYTLNTKFVMTGSQYHYQCNIPFYWVHGRALPVGLSTAAVQKPHELRHHQSKIG